MSITTLPIQLIPIIQDIISRIKKKKINGTEFIDFEEPDLSNIKQLNEILKQNGLEPIDENRLKAALIDIDQVEQNMQRDFTEDELAKALEPPPIDPDVEPEQNTQPGQIDPTQEDQTPRLSEEQIDQFDLCAPPEIEETLEFSENEVIGAACEVPVQQETPVKIAEVIPEIPPPGESTDIQNTSLPEISPEDFNRLLDEMKATQSADIFPKNAPDCVSKMNEIVKSVQEKVKKYTEIKNKIQEIQLDYYYHSIVDAYYQSFLEGYGEVNRLNEQLKDPKNNVEEIRKKLQTLDKDYEFASEDSVVQKKMEEIILSFSNQFDIEIDAGFLGGIFGSSPLIKINKENLPIKGKIKDIPDEFMNYVNGMNMEKDGATDDVKKQGSEMEKNIENEFKKTVDEVSRLSFAFGVNRFLEKEAIENDFMEISKQYNEKSIELSKQYKGLKEEEKKTQEEIDGINKTVTEELAKLNCQSKEVPAKVESGKDLNFKNVSKNPTIFDYAWWVKFCKLATIVNLVPVHWPVGLLIPSPAGLFKIPFPIIWIPVFIAPTDKMIAVLLIGQCGVLPCPYLFLQHFLPIPLGPFQSSSMYFAFALGGPTDISTHEPLPPVTLPSFDLTFAALAALLENFRNGVTADINALVQEVKNQLKDVQRQADSYLANASVDINKIIENAKNQGQQIVNSAKETAQAAIKQAKDEGKRLIDEAKQRYTDLKQYEEAALNISRNIQAQIDHATKLVKDAIEQAEKIRINADEIAASLKKRAEDLVKGIIENGKQIYKQKLQEFERYKEEYEKTLKTLRDLIDKIRVPTIDLGLINLSALLTSFSLALGSLVSLAASLSPKMLQFGFPTEISPSFSASLPMAKDELPVWERLSLLNIPFLLFLWKWCKSGKYVGGFLPESVFGPTTIPL